MRIFYHQQDKEKKKKIKSHGILWFFRVPIAPRIAIFVSMSFLRSIKGSTLVELEQAAELSQQYVCILHNDHFTTRDFVVQVLISIFHLNEPEAQKKMLEVHQKGQGRVGRYSYDVALTKAMHTEQRARENQFPLKCTIEPL